MIDYLLQFPDEATAQADPVVGAYWLPETERGPGAWRGDCVIPAAQAWHPSEDVVTQVPDREGNMMDIITHQFLPGFYIIIVRPEQDPDLDDHPETLIVTDREGGAADEVDYLIFTAYTPAEMADLMVQPLHMGCNYPFQRTAGNWLLT